MKALFASFLAVFLVSSFLLSVPAATAADESGITVNASDLYQAFKRDATAARKKYYGKKIVVTGIITMGIIVILYKSKKQKQKLKRKMIKEGFTNTELYQQVKSWAVNQ